MKKSRFSEPQIVGILKELEAGSPATELDPERADRFQASGGESPEYTEAACG